MSSFWDEIVQANDELMEAMVDALNISSWFDNNTNATGGASSFFSGPAAGAAGSVMSSFSSGARDALKTVRGFIRAVNWSEPFFPLLLLLHAVITAGTVAAIRHGASETVFVGWMCVLVALVVSSSYLNQFGSDHARTVFFPSEDSANYFDEHGVFITVVWSAPIILQILIMMFVLVVSTAKLFAMVRIQKYRAKVREEHQQGGKLK